MTQESANAFVGNIPEKLQFPDIATIEQEAKLVDTRAVLDDGPSGGIHPAAIALALLRDITIPTDEIKAAAKRRLAARLPQLHTFVPLYITNHCDSECKMCGMRKGNTRLIRKFAGKKTIEEQLQIIYEHERILGVGFVTGEYGDEYTRLANAFRTGWAIRTAFDIGFKRIYFNIGSMGPGEIEVLAEWIDRDDPVTMCVFQETYDRDIYSRFMGTDPSYPKTDYDRRIASFEHWLDAGFRYVNPGSLVGLHRDIASEIVSLVSHVTHLANRGAVVDVSLPRMRPAHGTRNKSGVDDDAYLRMIATIALVCPDQRIVLTGREEEAFQREAIDLCGVFSPGSPDVAPYRYADRATNDAETSQFIAGDSRRPHDVLVKLQASGRAIDYFVGAAS
jgi:2-iminoacetate synthase